MIKLIDLSHKTLLKSNELSSLETNTAQFIKSSFKILDNMRQTKHESEIERVHYENVLFTLDKLLAKLVIQFKEQEGKKLDRVLQQKSHLKRQPKIQDKNVFPIEATFTEGEVSGRSLHNQLEPAQLELLQREKVQMQMLYNRELEEVYKVEETLLQISNMQSIIEEQIALQADKIESIYDASWEIQATVKKGNEQLIKAGRNSSDFRLFLTIFLLVAAMSLVFLNWYK